MPATAAPRSIERNIIAVGGARVAGDSATNVIGLGGLLVGGYLIVKGAVMTGALVMGGALLAGAWMQRST